MNKNVSTAPKQNWMGDGIFFSGLIIRMSDAQSDLDDRDNRRMRAVDTQNTQRRGYKKNIQATVPIGYWLSPMGEKVKVGSKKWYWYNPSGRCVIQPAKHSSLNRT